MMVRNPCSVKVHVGKLVDGIWRDLEPVYVTEPQTDPFRLANEIKLAGRHVQEMAIRYWDQPDVVVELTLERAD